MTRSVLCLVVPVLMLAAAACASSARKAEKPGERAAEEKPAGGAAGGETEARMQWEGFCRRCGACRERFAADRGVMFLDNYLGAEDFRREFREIWSRLGRFLTEEDRRDREEMIARWKAEEQEETDRIDFLGTRERINRELVREKQWGPAIAAWNEYVGLVGVRPEDRTHARGEIGELRLKAAREFQQIERRVQGGILSREHLQKIRPRFEGTGEDILGKFDGLVEKAKAPEDPGEEPE